MVASRFSFIAPLVAGVSFAACGNNAGTPDYCGSPDPCGCVPFDPAETCVAKGTACVCTANAEDAGAIDSGANDSGSEPDVMPAPYMANFIGTWSPTGGTGQADCSGQITPLRPNPDAVLTFAPASPSTLTATSSGAYGCMMTLGVSGQTATLAQSFELCAVPGGGEVDFTAFTLVFTPGGPLAPDAGADADAEADVDAADPNADSGADPNTNAGADATAASDDAGPAGTLDWQLADTEGACVTTLHYTLARVK